MKFKQLYYIIIVSFIGLGIHTSLLAQDISFVQSWNATQVVNPALAGSFNETWRATINYRDGFQNIPGLYSSTYGAVDYTHQFQNEYGQIDQLGANINAIYDQSNYGGLSYTYVSLGAAYHKSLDINNRYHIGLGFKATYGNQLINYNKFVFNNQFSGTGNFDPNISSGEILTNSSYNFFDVQVGVLWQSYSRLGTSYNIGFSVNHLGRPRQSRFDKNKVPLRYNLHGTFEYPILEKDFIRLYGIASFLNPAYYLMVGGVYAHDFEIFPSSAHFLFGAYYQITHTLSPYIGFENKNFQFGITYDLNFSILKTKFSGALELSGVYKIPGKFIKPRVEIGSGYSEDN